MFLAEKAILTISLKINFSEPIQAHINWKCFEEDTTILSSLVYSESIQETSIEEIKSIDIITLYSIRWKQSACLETMIKSQ